ncbi:hypothetical protein CTEN210_12714 [Chaetoceros tenuissimus]|uniref:Uncharacterized protein n=1 Tax=Chaetoceros tenuissimus TaxID=426638 RepID=A0AAD3HAR8_9STRA|nr:hypothetical protein CTEN210_12714 [Chaetoceros tenuissimus]
MITIARPSRILSRRKLGLTASFDRLLQEDDFFASSSRDVKKITFSCQLNRKDLSPSSSSFELNQRLSNRVSLVNNKLFASSSLYPHASIKIYPSTRKIHSTILKHAQDKQETKLKAGQETFIDSPNNKKDPVVLKTNPRALFPWRHSPYVLKRINPESVEFITQGAYPGPHLPFMNQFVRSLAWINAAGFLGAKVLSYFSWQRELEEGFLYAFEVAVQEMLDDVYKNSKTASGDGNEEEVIGEENEGKQEEISIKKDKEGKNETTETIEAKEEGNATSDKESATEDFPISFQHSITPTDDYHLKQASQEDASHHMIESTLISLYRSAHTFGKHKLEINLQSRPKEARLESLFVFPFLTRKEVEDHLHLKHNYRNIVKAIQTKTMEAGRELSFYEIGNVVAEELDQLSAKQMRRNASGNMQITIVAQVSIQCDEIFKVVDTEIGDVVQGDKDGKINDVTHLVRFEMVVDLTQDGDVQLGTWQITDWDDLLDGNMFFSDYHTV